MLKRVKIKFILLFIGFIFISDIDAAYAESSKAGNGGSAQVHVRFKIVIAPNE